jgi:hypothetical protein
MGFLTQIREDAKPAGLQERAFATLREKTSFFNFVGTQGV